MGVKNVENIKDFSKSRIRHLDRFIKVGEIVGFTDNIMKKEEMVLICTNRNRYS